MNESVKQATRLSVMVSTMLCLLMIAFAPRAFAVQASPEMFEEVQPDGTRVKLHIRGDETYNWLEDENGFTVVQSNNFYVYGRLGANGDVVPSPYRVGRRDPAGVGLTPGIKPAPAVLQQLRANRPNHITVLPQGLVPGAAPGPAGGPEAGPPPIGTRKNLVVLVRFSNHTGRTLPTRQNFETLFNAPGGHPTLAPTGSVRDYYLENSYGQLTLESTVLDWVTVPQTEAYYANGNSGLSGGRIWEALIFALNAADATIDFSDFDEDNDGRIDAIAFVHSGYAAEFGATDAYGTPRTSRIWSHKWAIQPAWNSADGVSVFDYHINPGVWSTSGSAIGRIGVICHETGHFFGLPDLYDTDSTAGDGIGSWGLMANSWGFDGSQYYPPHMSSWSKIQLGWVTPTVISTSGTYELQQYETSPEVFRIDDGFPPNEYLLIENRQPVGFEAAMPQGGLCVFHIDENAGYNTQGYPGQTGWPENGNHYRVAVLQADGDYDLETGFNRGDAGDVYRDGGVSTLGPGTLPSTDAYQGGNVYSTGNLLYNIQKTGANMAFTYAANTANSLADISLSTTSLSFASDTPDVLVKFLPVSNDADVGGQTLDYSVTATSETGEKINENVGTEELEFSPIDSIAIGNVFEIDTSVSLTGFSFLLNYTGSANLTFMVYELENVTSGFPKVRIFNATGSVTGIGRGNYGIININVPLQAGKLYILAVSWVSPAIGNAAEFASEGFPETSFGRVNRGFARGLPLAAEFTSGLANDPYVNLQTVTLSVPWLSVTESTGSIAPQTTQYWTAVANATGFDPGTYSGEITINSNDPDENPLIVPVGLLVGLQDQIYVDFGFAGPEFGTMANPYNTLTESLNAVQEAGTVTIVGGGLSPETPDISQNVTIEIAGEEATIGASGESSPTSGRVILSPDDTTLRVENSGVVETSDTDPVFRVHPVETNGANRLFRRSAPLRDTQSDPGEVQPAAEQNRPTPQRSERGAARGRNR